MLQRFQEFATIHILIRRQPIMQSGCRFPGVNGNEFGEFFSGLGPEECRNLQGHDH